MMSSGTGAGMQLRLLGPIELVGPEGSVDLGGARPARLLATLFTAPGHRLEFGALIERGFDDADRPDDGRPAIRTAVRRLRKSLGDDTIVTESGGYRLDLSQLNVDIDRFDELIAAGRAASDPIAAISSFRRALDLWRGRPFGDLDDLDWLIAERVRLEEAHLLALEGWHAAHLRNGTATEIIPSLEAATIDHPTRERLHRQLMHALYVADRQADALRAFQAYRNAMAEAGLEPSSEAIELEQRIAVGDPSLRVTTEGRPLRGYRIVERLGEGAFSIVYKGTQPSVGRDVAIKQIRSELANRPDFIRRFEAEAHMVANLEHPYIVPLYDYWREPGSAYLVMRLLPGGNLESSLRSGPWDLARTSRLVEQIGSALAVAHRSGVVHRDVKPANILLDDDGNSYLTDFGIALAESELADPEASLSAGSPAYASPEQLRRERVGPSADVHGLAIAVYEALAGRLPFPDEPNQAALLQRQLHDPIPPLSSARSDLPAAVDDVLQRATAKVPTDRYQTIEEFVTAFEDATGEPSVVRPGASATLITADERNPFKGLRAFDESDASDFTGRDRLVDQLIGEIGQNRVVAVVGPSGSGKSSVVRAGLLPALRREGVPGSADWFVSTLMPGPHPHEELEAALLRVASERPPGLLDVLNDGTRGISRAIRQVLPENGQLLLVIDQFEEVFTLCQDEAERRRFLDGLADAAGEERSRLRIVLTLRADFYDRPLRYESIGRLVRDATVPVLPLAADELERVIVDPAHAVGCEYEPGLVAEIMADVNDQPGALPLLQYALTELWERRVSGLLTRDAYRQLGGVTGALARQAEQLFAGSSPEEQAAAQRLFHRLVTLGEGTEDTRRRVSRSEFGDDRAVDPVIDRLGRAHLLSFDRDPVTREPTIEVAHEALIREWPRLRAWLDDDRDGLRIHRHLTDTAQAWHASGRDAGELYRGARLDSSAAWRTDHSDDINETEREFLDASISLRDAEQAAEQEHLEQQIRSNRRLRVLVAVATVIAVIAAVAGVFALQQRSRADDEANEAQTRAAEAEAAQQQADLNAAEARLQEEAATRSGELAGELALENETRAIEAEEARDRERSAAVRADFDRLVALARTNDSGDPALGMLLAVEAHRMYDEQGTDTFQAQSDIERQDALQRSLTAVSGFRGFIAGEDYLGGELLDDDTLLMVVGANTVDVWDLESRTLVHRVPHSNDSNTAQFDVTGDGQLAAARSGADATVLYDLTAERQIGTLEHGADVNDIGLSYDGRQLAAALADGRVEIWDIASQRLTSILDATDSQASMLRWSPVDDLLAVATVTSDIQMWDPAATEPLWSVAAVDPDAREFAKRPLAMMFTPAGDGIVVFTGTPEMQVFDTADGTPLTEPFLVNAEGVAFVFDSLFWVDADALVIGSPYGGGIELIDLRNGVQLPPAISGVSYTDGVFSVSLDRYVGISLAGLAVWSTDRSGPLERLIPLTARQREILAGAGGSVHTSMAPDGSRLLTSAIVIPQAETVSYDLRTEPATVSVFEPTASVAIGWGEYTMEVGFGGIRILDVDLEPLGPGAPLAPDFNEVTASQDGRFFAVGRSGGLVDLHTAAGDLLATLTIDPDGEVPGAIVITSFSNDGSLMAGTMTDGTFAVWSTETLERIDIDIEGIASGSFAGPWLWALRTADGNVLRIDPLTSEIVGTPLLPTPFGGYSRLDETNMRLAGVGTDSVTVVDVETDQQIGRALPYTGLRIEWSGDGSLLSVPDGDHVVLWNFDTDEWPEIACATAGRNLTRDEWESFGPRTGEYRATCPQFPIED